MYLKNKGFGITILLSALLLFQHAAGQQTIDPKRKKPLTRILFIFDASQSMSQNWEKNTKINIAREILIGMIDSLEKIQNVQIALRIYGHQSPVPPKDCSDTRLEVPFGANTAPRIRQKLRYIEPRGTTPLASSLEQSIKDFPPCEDCRNIVILITDGMEACDGDPCEVSRNLQKKGITLKPFIIGIGLDTDFRESFNCIGTFYNAAKEEKFKEILNIVVSQALDATTAQVNLLDAYGKPSETNVNMSFYNYVSNKLTNSYIHTMNNRGLPDTIILDPLVVYRMTIQTIPPVLVDSFRVTPGKHNTITAKVPQGFLSIKTEGGNQYRDVICVFRQAGTMNTLNYQQMAKTVKYLTGKYDIEIPVIPKINIYNVEIKQSTKTEIKVPQPGLITFLMSSPGFGSIFLRETGKEMKLVYNLNKNTRNEILMLQPGSYTVVFRPGGAKSTLYTVSKTFEVTSGSSKVVELY